ncbi:thiol-disulfide oxidoreductase DCC family protein [Flavitalea flava]
MDTLPSMTILFDGVCNLCNGSVQFILKRDKSGRFRFASLQSDAGQAILQKFGLPPSHLNSFILIENEKVYTRSLAALRVLEHLGGGWSLFYSLRIIPAFIRDGIYNWVSRNRYRWFGKQESCLLPKPEWKDRFL